MAFFPPQTTASSMSRAIANDMAVDLNRRLPGRIDEQMEDANRFVSSEVVTVEVQRRGESYMTFDPMLFLLINLNKFC